METQGKEIEFDDKGNPVYEIAGQTGTVDDFLSGKATGVETCGDAVDLYLFDIQVRAQRATESPK